jgi:hypothetical protein
VIGVRQLRRGLLILEEKEPPTDSSPGSQSFANHLLLEEER